jgi:hypothetical protein
MLGSGITLRLRLELPEVGRGMDAWPEVGRSLPPLLPLLFGRALLTNDGVDVGRRILILGLRRGASVASEDPADSVAPRGRVVRDAVRNGEEKMGGSFPIRFSDGSIAGQLQSNSWVYRKEDEDEEALFIELGEKQEKAKSLAVVSAI